MTKDKKAKNIRFGIRSIRTDEFATIEIANLDDQKVQLVHSFIFSAESEFNLISVSFKLTFNHHDKPFIVIQVTCGFEVKFEDLDANNSGKLVMPKDFITHLAFLTTGTTRGVLHAKLEQTPYSKFMLPILDVSSVFQEDLVLELTGQTEKKAS